MLLHGIGYTLIAIVGPIVLALVILFAVIRNRQAGNRARTEQATRELYKSEDKISQRDTAV